MTHEKPDHQPPLMPGEPTEIGPRLAGSNPTPPGQFVTTERFDDRMNDLHDSIKDIRGKEEVSQAKIEIFGREIGEEKMKVKQQGEAIARVGEELRHAGGPNVNLQAAFATLNIKLDQSLEAHGFTTSIRDTIVKAVAVGVILAMLAGLVYGITLLRDLGQ